MLATRFPRLWRLLTGEEPQQAQERAEARKAYWAAVARSDTRGQHEAYERLRALTNRELAVVR